MATEPLAGFPHLTVNWEACIEAYGQYHVSVARRAAVSDEEVAALRRVFHGEEMVLPVEKVRSDGFLVLGACPLYTALQPLHDRAGAGYEKRELHISA